MDQKTSHETAVIPIRKPKATISEITFSSGDSVSLEEKDKVILVGPNNSGKSQSLREIVNICQTGTFRDSVVITGLELDKQGNAADLLTYLKNNGELKQNQYRIFDYQIHEGHVTHWDTNSYLINGLHVGSVKNIAANERLSICNQQSSISPGQHKSKPQHVMYDDDEVMAKVSNLFKRAFSKELFFDFRGGSTMPIHVGHISNIEGLVDRVSNEYIQEVRKNPLLDQQGDGIKSYAGILFEAVVSERDITLIDEPEAFLHPPQMRRLGETLSSEVKGQLIVATHSSDILRGFLEGTRGKVRILRIQREGDINTVHEATTETIKELWEKPELRYSNALEGIFHEQTIICEDDSDCRLINSVADFINATSDQPNIDTAYVPTGGKHGIPKVASVLRQIGVPIKAIFDIDFLSEKQLVQKTVEAFGGDWNLIETLWQRVDSAVRGGNKPKDPSEIKSDIISLLNNTEESKLPKSEMLEMLKQGKPWSEVKKYGEIAIKKGQGYTDYINLKTVLEELGIFVIPVGEIENFCPDIGSHGPKYVTKLLATKSLNDPSLQNLRDFVEYTHRK